MVGEDFCEEGGIIAAAGFEEELLRGGTLFQRRVVSTLQLRGFAHVLYLFFHCEGSLVVLSLKQPLSGCLG